MAGPNGGGEFDEIVNEDYKSKALVITDAIEVIAKADTGNLDYRQILTITNNGDDDVYYGPTGTTVANRDKLVPCQFMSIPVGECIDVTFICDTGETATIIVQEWS